VEIISRALEVHMTYLETVLLERLEKLEKRIDELEKKLAENSGNIKVNDPVKKQVLDDINEAISKGVWGKDYLMKLRAEVLSDKYNFSDKYTIYRVYRDIRVHC
jgi:hypothetical protein